MAIVVWGNGHTQYTALAKSEFSAFDNADPFIVATALEKAAIVVSQEISAPAAKKNIKFPGHLHSVLSKAYGYIFFVKKPWIYHVIILILAVAPYGFNP